MKYLVFLYAVTHVKCLLKRFVWNLNRTCVLMCVISLEIFIIIAVICCLETHNGSWRGGTSLRSNAQLLVL